MSVAVGLRLYSGRRTGNVGLGNGVAWARSRGTVEIGPAEPSRTDWIAAMEVCAMNQRNWWRFAFAAPIMLAVILGSGAVRAQTVDQGTAKEPADQEMAEKSADQATVEYLMRTVADQQRQIDNQQRQLELQAEALNNLQQQIETVRQSAIRDASQQPVFRSVARQRAQAQEEGTISGLPPNRFRFEIGRIRVHRAGGFK